MCCNVYYLFIQAACAVQEIYDLIGRADMPLIICGDFNAPNDHPTYKMFSNGRLEISPLKKQISLSAEEFNVIFYNLFYVILI